MLEVVGVTGVMHLGQIQSGLRGAMRIAQVNVNNCIRGRIVRRDRPPSIFRYVREHSVTAREKKKEKKSFGISPGDNRMIGVYRAYL